MGTSSSSGGPGAGVSFDPPWLDSVASEMDPSSEQESSEGNSQPDGVSDELAPSGRFGPARRHIRDYISSGNTGSLRKALGSYSRKGMGGGSNVARRMRASTSTGAGLHKFLQEMRDNSNLKVKDWVEQLKERNLSPSEIADEIIQQVVESGGSLDEESCKNSMSNTMSEFLKENPDIDLTNLSDDNIGTVLELFIGNEAFNRLALDIGQRFENSTDSPIVIVKRMNEMRRYLKAEISAQITNLRDGEANPAKQELNSLLQSALQTTFEIFEDEE